MKSVQKGKTKASGNLVRGKELTLGALISQMPIGPNRHGIKWLLPWLAEGMRVVSQRLIHIPFRRPNNWVLAKLALRYDKLFWLEI
jgi:hypothetical protein